MGKSLVIVESPAKARTISKFLGGNFVVESSIGHIRDLPRNASETPPSIKDKPWKSLAVDVESGFQPYYIVPKEKKEQVRKLKSLVKEADTLYLATDEDREGESISWHLCEVLKPKIPSKRLVFHEITKEAIQEALESPRELDEGLVRAQETRRILDRLYGYQVSEVLWRKIKPRLSAGRVQSVAVRIIVDRERERIAFVPASYWDLIASFGSDTREGPGFPLGSTLISVHGKRVATGRDFDAKGKLKSNPSDVVRLDETAAKALVEKLRSADFEVSKVERKPYMLKPNSPFTTSTLQQEANRKLRFTTKVTMQLAQRLYENGYITYMRTDSTTLSDQAVKRVRNLISELYGDDYLPEKARTYKTKVKNAQEAHEAIRPAGDLKRPEELRGELNADQLKLYELIWKRTVACQMESARGHRVVIQVSGGGCVFQATGKTVEFPGFLRAYVEGADDPQAELADKETLLPSLEVGEGLRLEDLEAKGHTTQPPPRFTEASLVKELEANGVGRPSTYASIITTILKRDYVNKQNNALVPTFTAFAVVELLKRNFKNLVDIGYTARMEEHLDEISRGEQEPVPYLERFYFGENGRPGLQELLKADIDPRESCTIPLGHDEENRAVNLRVGRYGPFIECGEKHASVPDGTPPDALDLALASKLLSMPRKVGTTPKGENVYVAIGPFGPYAQLGESDAEEKPKRQSLMKGMDPFAVDYDDAMKLLSLPRLLGKDPESGDEIWANNGKYGPYLTKGKRDSRSLKNESEIFTIDLPSALHIFKTVPKGRARSAPKLVRALGKHTESGEEVNLMDGRFGTYVTDGAINATVPQGINPDELTLTEAEDLLKARAEKLAAGGGKRGTKKTTKKKAKKAPKTRAKKTAKKAKKKTAKKSAAKKVTKKAAK